MQVVSYNSEDAGGTYWVQVDPDTGEITAYSPAVTEDEPGRAAWLPVGDRWSRALSGPTALLAGEGYGIDYQQSVDGASNIFYFAAGDKEYQAKDREIHYTPSDKRLWVENESGIFLFDNTTHEWTRVAEQGTQMIGVGDEQMIIADEAWHTIESIDGSGETQIVTTQDGQKWVWGQDGWARYEAPSLAPPFSPELVKALQDNGLSVSPDDLCLWEGTEGATVQCLTLNPEAVPELADNLRQMTNTVAWLYTWDKKDRLPGKYPTLASYEAMLKRQPLQKAVDVPVIWHPESAQLDPSAALWQKASELAGPDGKSVGVDATIDLSTVGLALEDWESVKDEGGWTEMDGGMNVKQSLEPIGGQDGVWGIVWRLAARNTTTSATAKYGADVIEKINLLYPDPLQPIDENIVAYNQSLRLLDSLLGKVVGDARGSLLYSGKGIQFGTIGRVSFEEREELKEGIEFFVTDK